MWIFIQPNDVWLFRNGRPFDAGSDHRAASIFPPNPTTVYGAICAAILTNLGVDFADYREREATGGNADLAAQLIGRLATKKLAAEAGSLRLTGPFLAKLETAEDGKSTPAPYFPAPADLVKIEAGGKPQPLALLAPQNRPMVTNWPSGHTLQPLAPHQTGQAADRPLDDGIDSASDKWLSAAGLQKYLAAEAMDERDLVSQASLFRYENRLGIGLSGDGKVSKDGLIYQTQFVRPEDGVGLLVKLEAGDGPIPQTAVPQNGWLALGGERKAASYQTVAEPAFFKHSGSTAAGRQKILFLNDTKLDGGWTSGRWHAHQLDGLISAAVAGYRSIGGWDVAHNRQKPMSRFVPAGSVYFFEQAAGEQPALRQIIDDESQAHFGYGCAVSTGKW